RDVTCLGLDDGKSGERTVAALLAHLRCALEQAAVQVEDVAREGLPARRTAEEERELTVGDGVLGEVVVDDEGVLSAVAEELAHGDAGVGGEELQRGGIGSA